MRGLPRGSLTRELLVRESLRLLDTDGVAGFSLPKLGRALGADPTAIYRHFASKDDLILAIAEAMIEESCVGLEQAECWVETMGNIARRCRSASLAHPAAASLVMYRTTQGPAEMRMVEMVLDGLHQAGFTGKEAALVYRAFADFALFWSGGEGSFLALDEKAQRKDREAWTRAYLIADRAVYPSIWRIREELPVVQDDEIFETILSVVLGGIMARAPRPCACPAHVTAAV
jgi:AcrR family transcriptional regulator